MFRRLAALTVLAFSFAVVSYSGMATGQDKDSPKNTAKSSGKSTGKKNTAKSSKKAAPAVDKAPLE
jgi:hypothetical protein